MGPSTNLLSQKMVNKSLDTVPLSLTLRFNDTAKFFAHWFLREIETVSKNTLWIKDQDELESRKNGVKISWHCLFKY